MNNDRNRTKGTRKGDNNLRRETKEKVSSSFLLKYHSNERQGLLSRLLSVIVALEKLSILFLRVMC